MYRGMLFIFVLLCCVSCKATKRAQLEENVRTYFLALRHADQAAVLSYVHPDKQQAFYETSQNLTDLRVSHVKVETIFPDEKLESAVVSAQIEFFSPGASLLETKKRKFVWKYHPEAKNWLLEEANPLGSTLVQR